MHTVYCAITSEFLFAYTGCYSIFRISQTRAQRLRAPQESGMQINHQRIHATRQDLLLEDREAGSKTASRREPVTLHTHCTKTATGTGSDSRTIPRIKDRPTRELTPVRLEGQKPRASNGSPGWDVVEMGGIEPPSNGRPRILLRAQSTVLFLSPQHCVDTPPDRLS